ncbi:MAG: hypothetical protein HC935_08900 [Pseudanabaena sp. SU_2_4]|nr:hypothetical protein [Pseudanabaena sp. SU_2_4]
MEEVHITARIHDRIAAWRDRFQAAVGENGQLVIDVIPELELLIGKQPPVPDLNGTAAENRFFQTMVQFVFASFSPECPQISFMDDVQWADLTTILSLRSILNLPEHQNRLLVVAYRDNEVSPAHPLMLKIEELKRAQTIVNTITLAPLALGDINHLVADTLNCSTTLAQPLTELIDRKTQGNPFFTTQFLKALHEDGHIIFDHDHRYWKCDIAHVNVLTLTDDVVEFMALQLQKLPPKTQQVLKLAACVGNQFDLATLAIVSEQSLTNTATALWKALQEGLILPTSQVYKFFQAEDAEQADAQNVINPAYRFCTIEFSKPLIL